MLHIEYMCAGMTYLMLLFKDHADGGSIMTHVSIIATSGEKQRVY